MAKKDASIPTLAHSHKNPADRAHVWERPLRSDEREPEPDPHADYQHELPRFLHKKGQESIIVRTPDACDAALADGWQLHPGVA